MLSKLLGLKISKGTRRIKSWLEISENANGKYGFLRSIPSNSRVVDVGCGNNGPYQAKSLRGDIYYIGLDIASYNQTLENLSDEYHELPPSGIIEFLQKNKNSFDAVVCAHVLEHSETRDELLQAMLMSLKVGGMLYLSFPSSKTTRFPSRAGSLNYFDDPTHIGVPPNTDAIDQIILKSNCQIYLKRIHNRTVVGVIMGLLNEFSSFHRKTILRGTWALWGFETVYWVRKAN